MTQNNTTSAKRILFTFILYTLFTLGSIASPSWTKSASKSVFTLKTFSADGSLLASSTGCFIGSNGEAISAYNPFRGAERAIIIDANGKEWTVACILGADETYDVAKFKVDIKETASLTIANSTTAIGATAYLLPYREIKNTTQGIVRKVEKFNNVYDYYTISMPISEDITGSPLMNERGEIIGLMQKPSQMTDTLCYAVSACFADSLSISGLSLNDPVIRAIGIKKALPADLSQAQLTLYIAASSLDSLQYAQLLDDFILQFPQAPDGYQYRASMALENNDFNAAQRDMETAIEVSDQKADAHYNYSRLILQKEIYKPDIAFAPWSLDKALKEAETAYQINPMPIYRQQQAQVLFAQKEYQKACDTYLELTNTTLRSADLFYSASHCQAQLGDTIRQLELLDSAVAVFSRPYLKEAAPYLLARAQTRLLADRYRDAVADLNDYETLMRTQVNDRFYYLRYQAETGGRLFQPALNDINRAIELSPKNSVYYAEKASLEVRVGLYEEAQATAQQLIQLEPKQSDGYLFLGLSQCLAGNKEEGLKQLQKAQQMGDSQAAGLIEKYAK